MNFKGKIGLWYYGTILFVNGLFLWIFTLPEDHLSGIAIIYLVLILVNIFLFSMIVRNYVFLNSDTLTVYLGFLKLKITVADIISVKKTHNPLSSMGLSLDRIEIIWRKGCVLISVRDKDTFLKSLCSVNPQIKVLK